MSTVPRVLLLGGHGKVALHMTPLLLSQGYQLTSVVRNVDHKSEIEARAGKHSENLSILVSSVEDIRSAQDAGDLLARTKPSIVIWAAGAGGKGGAFRTKAVDEVAAKHVISASIANPQVKKFLMVSYIASRRNRAPWWTDEDWEAAQNVNNKVLPAYFAAKVEADEHLLAASKKRMDGGDSTFQMINLRPGTLSDDPSTGKVKMGATPSRGKIGREDVAKVAVALMDRDDTRGYFDLLQGEDDVGLAIDKVVKEGHDGSEGEDMERIYAREV